MLYVHIVIPDTTIAFAKDAFAKDLPQLILKALNERADKLRIDSKIKLPEAGPMERGCCTWILAEKV